MENLILVKTKEQLNELNAYLKDKEYIAFDTETTGIDKEAKVIGISVCAEVDIAYYIILSYWDTDTQSLYNLETLNDISSFLKSLQNKKLLMHNAIFDCLMIENNFSIELMPSVHTDTMILSHVLNENRHNGLKELGVSIFGEDSREEQLLMKESVSKNGGVLTKEKYELYKADADLLGKYGAKDALLTYKLFWVFIEQLFEQKLDSFFYEDESMPLLKGPTYDLNKIGLRIDSNKLSILKGTLEVDCMEAKAFIYQEINNHISEKYPGTSKKNVFNIGSSKQLAWLLYIKLDNEFITLTKEGKNLCKALNLKIPYSTKDKYYFINQLIENKGKIYEEGIYNTKTKKISRPKKIGDVWNYLSADKISLAKFSKKYKWVEKFLEYNKNLKLLNTYVEGIKARMQYNIIYPNFLQHGTTSGRYSCKNPNFQNLPKDDKRVKSCIISRPGKVFVGADYSQLEPRVFASMSKDERLMESFAKGEDFYSVVGVPIFETFEVSLIKDEINSFATKYPKLRDKSKVIALATPYGRTASYTAEQLNISRDEAQDLMDKYFENYPKVELMMLESHEQAKKDGVVYNLFGRPRRIPEAKNIYKFYGTVSHSELPYEARTLLNLAMNHRIQSTGASIINRATIAFWKICKDLINTDKKWDEVKIVMQIHDELIIECPEELKNDVKVILKDCMENTSILPGVSLVAEPKIANNIADLK